MNIFDKVLEPLINRVAWKATLYESERDVITATRRRFKGKFGQGNVDIILKIGRPNYVEREFIKACKKAGEPFPVKKVQLKLYNPKPSKNLRPRVASQKIDK